MDIMSIVILVIMVLILGNTIAMGVRERTNEYGVLRAIGFLPKHITLFVVGEAITIALAGGLLGIVLAFPLIEKGLGRYLEENVGGLFPYFRISETTVLIAAALSVVLGGLAAAIPAYRAAKLDVIDALRRIG
jgi:putative ABC transport system permease protein